MSQISRFDSLAAAARRYGSASLDNYALIRSFAEKVCKEFCAFLGNEKRCVFLVPPEGGFSPQDYGSGAFSVSGAGFLPLGPIQFGLAVRVSETGDWIRVVLSAEKEGPDLDVTIIGGRSIAFRLPLDEGQLEEFYTVLLDHLTDWFNERADHYEEGRYGNTTMGFEFIHADESGS